MYKSFYIDNFRAFSTLSLQDCERVNIIIGKNNAGKTALLEALFLHIGSMNPQLTVAITSFRGILGVKPDADSLWSPLFNNYNIDKPINLVAEYPDHTRASLLISLVPSSLVSLDQIELKNPEQHKPTEQISLIPEKYLQYDYEHKSKSVKRTTTITPGGFDIKPPVGINPFQGFFIPARQQLDPGAYAQRFGILQINKLDYIVLNALRVLEPNLKSLAIIPIGPVPTIHVDIGGTRLMPIQLAGEGMTRIAEISIDIASAPNGIVLVDDIDTGIHHTALPAFWKVIFQLTKKSKTQLFATTHSSECLEAAHQSMSSMKKYDMKVHRLQRIKDSVRVISYDSKKLETAIETGLEVR